MKLVPDAKNWWRWFSVQAMALATAMQGAWLFVPADLRAGVPDWVAQIIMIVLLLAGVFGRVVDQGGKE